MKRKIIPLFFCKSRVPLVSFRLAGKEHYAIIDTGSEVSILDSELEDKITTRKTDSETNIVGVNGGSGYKKVLQGVGGVQFVSDDKELIPAVLGGMVYDLSDLSRHFKDDNEDYLHISAIIGGDFLKHYNARIDYRKKEMTIDDVER